MFEYENLALDTAVGGKPKVEIRGVTKVFSDNSAAVTALDNVSLTINAGEFFCLLGTVVAESPRCSRCSRVSNSRHQAMWWWTVSRCASRVTSAVSCFRAL